MSASDDTNFRFCTKAALAAVVSVVAYGIAVVIVMRQVDIRWDGVLFKGENEIRDSAIVFGGAVAYLTTYCAFIAVGRRRNRSRAERT